MNRLRILPGFILVSLLLSLTFFTVARAAPQTAPIDPYIWKVIGRDGQAEILLILREQANVDGAAQLATRTERTRYVYEQLTQTAERTQPPLRAYLERRGIPYRSYWIRNMIQVSADAALVQELARRPEIARIDYLYPAYPEPISLDSTSLVRPTAIEWNITRVHAPDVWATLGITGTGAIVGDLDTGVQWDHPALINSYRGNLGGGVYDHNYNWWDGPGGSPVPLDYDQHGTHTMGTIVGDDGAGNQIGMAPGARWIACAGLGEHENPFGCFQFFLAPTDLNGQNPRPDLAPHVINNSWTSATDYRDIIHTLYMAGIFYAKSAGNTGPNCGTVTNPGQWPEVMATAAFASGDTIASFSSRGPVTIGHDTFTKPDIAAPGVNVRSSIPGNAYAAFQGTSMACPHVTGAVALLISARPDLAGRVDVLQMILKQTAEPMYSNQGCGGDTPTTLPNNMWGYGILNVYDAVLMAQGLGMGAIEGTVTDAATTAPVADAAITFENAATLWQLHDTSAADGSYDHPLPTATYNVTATHYGYLPAFITGVVITDGVTTTLDIPLLPAPLWTVSGTVTEWQTGDPLAASILFEETPVSTGTDPETGLYSADVAQGIWWMRAASPGHATEFRQIVLDQNMVQDFSLEAIHNYYMDTDPSDICGPVIEWMDASGGTVRNLGDDASIYVALPTGRTFTFYGNTYSGLFVGSNGIVTFGSGSSKWSGPIPDPATPNNGIYAFSTDLNPANGAQGSIYTHYLDNRYFVIEYLNVQHYPSGDPETFEIILDLDTGRVTIQFLTVSNPADTVVGVENATGSEATQYANSDPALIADNVRVDFYPIFGTPPPTGGPGALQGRVTDSVTALPIEGATVSAEAFTTGELTDYTTNANGEYGDTPCADWYTLSASAPGYLPSAEVRVAVVEGGQTVQDFALDPIPCEAVHDADFSWLPLEPQVGEEVTFTAVASGTAPITFDWAFGDGEVGSGATVTHTYTLANSYPVTLTASNCVTATQTVVHTLTVLPPPRLIYLPIILRNTP